MSVVIEEDQVRIHEHLVTEVSVVSEFITAVEAGKSPEDVLNQLLSLGSQVAALGSSTASADKIEASVGQNPAGQPKLIIR